MRPTRFYRGPTLLEVRLSSAAAPQHPSHDSPALPWRRLLTCDPRLPRRRRPSTLTSTRADASQNRTCYKRPRKAKPARAAPAGNAQQNRSQPFSRATHTTKKTEASTSPTCKQPNQNVREAPTAPAKTQPGNQRRRRSLLPAAFRGPQRDRRGPLPNISQPYFEPHTRFHCPFRSLPALVIA